MVNRMKNLTNQAFGYVDSIIEVGIQFAVSFLPKEHHQWVHQLIEWVLIVVTIFAGIQIAIRIFRYANRFVPRLGEWLFLRAQAATVSLNRSFDSGRVFCRDWQAWNLTTRRRRRDVLGAIIRFLKSFRL